MAKNYRRADAWASGVLMQRKDAKPPRHSRSGGERAAIHTLRGTVATLALILTFSPGRRNSRGPFLVFQMTGQAIQSRVFR